MNPLSFLEGTYWFAPPGTKFAEEVIWTFNFILWVSIVFFVLIVGLGTYFVVKYRRREGVEPEPSPHHSNLLELSWSIIPTILCVMMFWYGFKTYMDMKTPPADTYDIYVTGQKWKWIFTYPDGTVTEEIHVPKGENIRLIMSSTDVLHSFFVPNFAVKMDVVPGRYSTLWFNAPATGTHHVFCTEYCGTDHSDMGATLVVSEREDFEAWLEEEANYLEGIPPEEGGRLTYERFGCAACHSLNGEDGIGPSFKGNWAWGGKRTVKGGEVVVDENYIRESILNPNEKYVPGFDEGAMPSFRGTLDDKKINALIAFLKDLNKGGE